MAVSRLFGTCTVACTLWRRVGLTSGTAVPSDGIGPGPTDAPSMLHFVGQGARI